MGTEDDGPLSLRVSTEHLGLSSVPPWNLLATELKSYIRAFRPRRRRSDKRLSPNVSARCC